MAVVFRANTGRRTLRKVQYFRYKATRHLFLLSVQNTLLSHKVSALFRTKLQQHRINSPLLFVTHPLSVPWSLLRQPFLFLKTFSLVPLPWGARAYQGVCMCVCMCVRVCVWVCGCVCGWVGVHAHGRMFAVYVFELLTSKYICMCKFVSAYGYVF